MEITNKRILLILMGLLFSTLFLCREINAQNANDNFGPLVIRDGCATKQQEEPKKNKMKKLTEGREEKKKKKKKIQVRQNFLMSRISLNANDQSSPEAVTHILKVMEDKKKIQTYQITKGTSFVKSSDIPIAEPYSGVLGNTSTGMTGNKLFFEHGKGNFAFDIEVDVENPAKGIEDYLALYMLIIHPATLSGAQKNKLREYLLRGGFLFADANCGNSRFYKIFKKEIESMFPGRRFVPLTPEHPVFRSFYNLTKMRYYNPTSNRWTDKPKLEGLRIGCRHAVILSPYCYSCGWDRHEHKEKIPGCIGWVGINDSIKLGVNMLSYAMEYRELNKPLLDKIELKAKRPATGTDFVLARLKFDGEWDPDPNSGINLLRVLNKALNADFYPKEKDITLKNEEIFDYPFVYLTGHGKVEFTQNEIAVLEQYLLRGGTLFADACCGDKEFRESFEALMQRMFGQETLKQIPENHFVYNGLYDVSSVEYTKHVTDNDLDFTSYSQNKVFIDGKIVNVRKRQTESVLRKSGDNIVGPPVLHGLTLNGRYAVIYSRLDLGCAWKGPEDNGTKCGFCKGVKGNDSYKLAANIVAYALSSR